MLKQLSDNTNPNSLASRMRQRRFAIFRELIADLPRPLSILDIGGTLGFWQRANFMYEEKITLTLLNLSASATSHPNITFVAGDARNMPQFRDHQFDIVFSNSTIEHVGDLDDQARMASEIRRVGKRYFVQTPNRYFPIEPHFLFPYFQFLPIPTRVWLLQNFNFSRGGRVSDPEKALQLVKEIRLLTAQEMQELFPDATLYRERIGGMVKSLVAYRF